MPVLNLTDLTVRHLKPSEGKQVIYTDKALKGFGVRVNPTGQASYVLTFGANRQRVTLGDVGIVKLAEARTAARTLLAEKQLGIHQHTQAPTYNDAFETFMLVKEQEHGCKPGTLKSYKKLLKRHGFGLDKVDAITPRDVQTKLDKLLKSPGTHVHVFAVFQIFFRFCFRRHYLDHNPMARMEAPKPRKGRTRVLSFDELKAVWHAGEGMFGDIIKLCMILGQRRSEVAAIEKEWVQGDQLVFPGYLAKNNQAWTVPLGPLALQILTARFNDTPYLFPARKTWRQKSSFYNAWGKDKPKLDTAAKVYGWVIHDLRRSFQTHLTSLGVSTEVSDRLMNHITGSKKGTLGVYQHYQYGPEKRAAMDIWETQVAKLIDAST